MPFYVCYKQYSKQPLKSETLGLATMFVGTSFFRLAYLLQIDSGIAKLVLTSFIDRIDPHLVETDEENAIITEASNPMQCGHLDNKREHIVNEGVQRLIDHGVDRNMGDTLEFVVDE